MNTLHKTATCLIADDETHLARALQAELARLWPELQVLHVARNGVEAAERIAALQPDLAFLDIQMPGLTGLEVAQGIEGHTRVVFVTAYDEYAVQAFDNEAIDYVLKPVNEARLQRTIERVQRALAGNATGKSEIDGDDRHGDDGGNDGRSEGAKLLAALHKLLPAAAAQQPRLRWVRASSGELMHQIPVEEVLFFRADDKYTCVQTASAEHLIRTPIAELAAALDPEVFVQVHRSTIVNLALLASTRRDDASRLFLRMRGHASELPVSRAYVHLFKAM